MHILNLILFGAKEKSSLKLIKPFAEEVNYKLLKGASITCIILLVLPLLEIIVFKELSGRFFFYLTFLLITVTVFVLTVFFAKKHPVLILPLFYILFVVCLAYGTWLGIFSLPEMTGVTFHIIVFVFPLLIADCPWRCDLIIIASCVVFMFFSYMKKTPAVFHVEFMNAMNSMVLSLVISTVRQIQNVQSFIDRALLKKQRDTDSLSRTLSRAALENGIKNVLQKFGFGGCLMFLDVDNFKHINDTYGHVIGDELIIEIGRCLRSVCRPMDIVGRYGGDEFMIFFPQMADKIFAEKRAEEIIRYVKKCDLAQQLNEVISVSIGCLIFQNGFTDHVALFSEVDNMLYEAKKNGKNQFCLKEM